MPRVDFGGGSVGLAVSPGFTVHLVSSPAFTVGRVSVGASTGGSVVIGTSEVSFAPDTGDRIALIAAAATFSPVVQIVQERGATITASATITAVTGVDFADRLASIAAAATVAPVVEVVREVSASIAAAATVSPVLEVAQERAAAISVAASVAPVLEVAQERAAAISVAASVAPVGQVVREVSASIAAAATVAPVTGSSEVASRSATVTVSATFSPVVQIVQERGATITATATVSPVGEDGSAPAPFSPTDVAGLAVWVDAGQQTSVANLAPGGSALSSGGVTHNATDSAFEFSPGDGIVLPAEEDFALVFMRMRSTDTQHATFETYLVATNGWNPVSVGFRRVAGNSGNATLLTGSDSLLKPDGNSYIDGALSAVMRPIDGVLRLEINSSDQSIRAFLGKNNGNTSRYNRAQVMEILAYTTMPTAQEIADIEAYMMSNHPAA